MVPHDFLVKQAITLLHEIWKFCHDLKVSVNPRHELFHQWWSNHHTATDFPKPPVHSLPPLAPTLLFWIHPLHPCISLYFQISLVLACYPHYVFSLSLFPFIAFSLILSLSGSSPLYKIKLLYLYISLRIQSCPFWKRKPYQLVIGYGYQTSHVIMGVAFYWEHAGATFAPEA